MRKNLNRLLVVMAEKQIKSKKLAEMMEVTPAAISAWRNNKSQPSLERLHQLAKVLDCDVCDLIGDNRVLRDE